MISLKVGFAKKIFTFCLPLMIGVVNAQTLFRWVDDAGRVHYADRPAQENVRDEQRLDRAKLGATRDNLEAQKDLAKTVKSQAESKRLQEESEKKAQARAEKERARERDCSLAQESVRQLSSGQTLAIIGEKGERKVLDSKEVSARLSAAQEQEKNACAPLAPEEPEVSAKPSGNNTKDSKSKNEKEVDGGKVEVDKASKSSVDRK